MPDTGSPSPSRRQFLRQTMHFSAAAVLAGVARGAAPALLTPAAEAPVCNLLAVGDFGVKGKDIARQQAVAAGMAKFAAATAPAAVLLLGDNFYGGLSGKGLASPRWREQVEEMYPAAAFPGPLYAVLGNHDYNDEKDCKTVAAQLEYRQSNPASRWTMPAKWYEFDLAAPATAGRAAVPLANVIALDTNLITNEKGATSAERKRQTAWLVGELARPRTAPFRIVIAHHPVFSDGSHGDAKAVSKELDALLRKYKVDLYLSGHDHDLQHIEVAGHPTSFVVSGAGGARARDITTKDEKMRTNAKVAQKARGDGADITAAIAAARAEAGRARVPRGPFWKPVYGFTHLQLTAERLAVTHVDANGNPLHTFARTPDGHVTLG